MARWSLPRSRSTTRRNEPRRAVIELQCVIDGSAIRARDIPGMTRAAGAIGWAVLVHGPQGTSVHADAFVVRDKAYRSIQTHELYAFAHAARLTQGLGVPARKLCIQTDDNRFQRANQFMASDQDSVLLRQGRQALHPAPALGDASAAHRR